MSVLTVIKNGTEKKLSFERNPILLEFLLDHDYSVEHACGQNGVCLSCSLYVNGKLLPSCQVRMKDGMVVELPGDDEEF